jgi:DNA-binding XRE family transcriptional regulator
MERKKAVKFIYEGLGFPVALTNVLLVKRRGVWTPAIDYNKLQKAVLLKLSHKSSALTGNEVHFIRAYFEMTLDDFAKQFGMTHPAVLNWEKKHNKPAKINPSTELCIRLFIPEKLNMNNQVFRETFRGFDMQNIAEKQKKAALHVVRPLVLPGSNVAKRLSA